MVRNFPESLKKDLDHCSRCGLCEPLCPSYKVMRMERYAPRGRVQMVRKIFAGELSFTKSLQEAFTSCISCGTCSENCPSGVRIDRVFSHMRFDLVQKLGQPLFKKMMLWFLRHPSVLHAGAASARIGQSWLIKPFNVKKKIGPIEVSRLPRLNKTPFREHLQTRIPPRGKKIGRVLYFVGCATDLFNEDIGQAAIKVLTGLGYEVIISKELGCCGLPIFLSGALDNALNNISKNLNLMTEIECDHVMFDCGTCGGAFKEKIPQLLEELGPDFAPLQDKALALAAKSRDVSEIIALNLDRIDLSTTNRDQKPLIVTYHDSCHLKRAMHISKEPRAILTKLPSIQYSEMPSPDECCGGGGAYQFEHAALSSAITKRKIHNIRSVQADILAVGCPGCQLTLSAALSQPNDPVVKHPVQLYAELKQFS